MDRFQLTTAIKLNLSTFCSQGLLLSLVYFECLIAARRVLLADKGDENGNATDGPKQLGCGRNIGQPQPGFSGLSNTNCQLPRSHGGCFDHFRFQRFKSAWFAARFLERSQAIAYRRTICQHFARGSTHFVASSPTHPNKLRGEGY